MICGYIFDYGGTLDTGGCHWGRYIGHAYQRQGVPVREQTFRDAYVYAERELGRNPIIQPHYTFRKTLDTKLRLEMDYIAKRQKGFSADEWHDRVLDDLYGKVLAETSRSRNVLLQLKEKYPLALVSNFYGNISTVLDEMQLNGIFTAVIESAVVGIRKPDPRIFSLGVEALRLDAKSVVVVGDSYEKDIVPARSAGCQTVWVKGEGWTDTEPDGLCAYRTISHVEELLQ